MKFKIETDANYELNQQRAAGYNVNIFMWNASLSKRFLKNENLIISIDATNLLDEAVTAKRDVQDNVISDMKSTVVGRYILLRAVFKINSNKGKDEDGFE